MKTETTISVTLNADDYTALIGVLMQSSWYDPKLVALADHMVALVKLVEEKEEV